MKNWSEYIITGLDEEFMPLVSAICARVEPISVSELYTQLLNFETHLGLLQEGQQPRIANHANRGGFRGRGGARGHGGRGAPTGRGNNAPSRRGNTAPSGRDGFGRGRGRGANQDDVPICQVCFKRYHTVAECWHRFDESYVPKQKFAHSTSSSYNVDTNWYMDTGATDHITGELEKLSIRNKYQGGDQIHTASGTGMDISNIGHTTFYTPNRSSIHLNNILYVPRTKKNLVSVHQLTSNNSIYIEFHPTYFLIKDRRTRTILLKGRCVGGLYPLPVEEIKQVCSAATCSINIWHNRLGHPAHRIVKKVVSSNNLLCSQESVRELVCDACQQAKSHQLPYSRSMRESKFPLELVFSDVWGPAPESVGRKNIMFPSLMILVNLLGSILSSLNLKFFQKFQDFQTLVERQFNRKILAVQTDWGGGVSIRN
jgi:hypothetical protein